MERFTFSVLAILLTASYQVYGVARTCSQLYEAGLRTNGAYAIDPDGRTGPTPVIHTNCNLNGTSGETVVHHDQEQEFHSNGHAHFGLRKDVGYKHLSFAQVRAIANASSTCEYAIRFRCMGSSMTNNGWKNYFGNDKAFFNTEGSVKAQQCEFTSLTTVNRAVTEKENFPMKQIMSGDSDDSNEEIYTQLGPMICHGGSLSSILHNYGGEYKDNTRVTNPEKVPPLKLCTLLECAMKCEIDGCALFSFSDGSCSCELTFGFDAAYRTYTETAATGFTLYKMY